MTLTSLLILTGTCSFAPKKENSLKERGIVWLEGWRGGVWRGVREVQRGGEGGGGAGSSTSSTGMRQIIEKLPDLP